MKPIKLEVTAQGSMKVTRPYEMVVRLSDHYIIIDGLKLSWNDARAAFDAMIGGKKQREALFGDPDRGPIFQ